VNALAGPGLESGGAGRTEEQNISQQDRSVERFEIVFDLPPSARGTYQSQREDGTVVHGDASGEWTLDEIGDFQDIVSQTDFSPSPTSSYASPTSAASELSSCPGSVIRRRCVTIPLVGGIAARRQG